MKRVLGVVVMMLCTVLSSKAQDFVSRFLAEHPNDSNLVCITVSPKMMAEIMKNDVGKSGVIQDMLVDVKSMQLLTAKTGGKAYFQAALSLADKNADRFELFSSFDGKVNDYQILVRRKQEEIVELVMLQLQKEKFAIIDLTGNMDDVFILNLMKTVGGMKEESEHK